MTATEPTAVEVPDIGDFEDVPIIELLVSEGDEVGVDDPLLTLESDKATMDVPAPFAGTVRQLCVEVGDKVSQGTVLLKMDAAEDGRSSEASAAESEGAPDEASAPDAVESAVEAEEQAPAEPDGSGSQEASGAEEASGAQGTSGAQGEDQAPAESEATHNGGGPIYASPSVRRLARERGVDLSAVKGSGRKGRITPEDVESATDGGAPQQQQQQQQRSADGAGLGFELEPWPSVDFDKQGPTERMTRSRIAKIAAPKLARNWVMIPHVTQHDEADITDLEEFRRKLNEERDSDGVKVTMVSFLVLACVATLKEFEIFNSSLDGDELVLKRYYNIGFAADTPQGLVVPVIKEADGKGLREIAGELASLSTRAREGKLSANEMQGATFTISSLGGIGGTGFTPIINAPEVAILGVSRSARRPVWDGSEFVPRLILPLSLSYDHRVIDGAAAARFTSHLGGVLGDLRRALL